MGNGNAFPPPGGTPQPPAAETADRTELRRVVFPSPEKSSSVSSADVVGTGFRRRGGLPRTGRQWQPPEALTPEEVKAVIGAAGTERDRLLLRVLWATGGRVSEVLALRGQDIRRDALVLPNLKNPSRPAKTVFLSAGDQDLPGELLLFQREQGLADAAPLFGSRTRGADGRPRALSRIRPGGS